MRAPVLLALLAVVPIALNAQSSTKSSMLSGEAYIKAAQKGAPASISAQAAIGRVDEKGITILRSGTNGFTCVYGVPGDPSQSPVCADANAVQWLNDLLSGKPNPTISAPGVAYMAQGGSHYVNARGETVMMEEAGAKVVTEPPHWMIFPPSIDAKTTGLPTAPKAGGTWVMFSGTPWAHLMIDQDPAKFLKQ